MKTLEEFLELFAEQLEETDASEIKANTIYKELDEWSSLTALVIIGLVDEEFGITINGEDIKSTTTLEDLYNVLKSKVL